MVNIMVHSHTSLSHAVWLILLSAVVSAAPADRLALADEAHKPSTDMTAAKAPLKHEVQPVAQLSDIALAPVEGYTDEAAYQQSQLRFTHELAEQAQQSDNPTKQAELWLLAANLTLAHSLEPACTRQLLRLPVNRQVEVDKSVSQMLDAADEYLRNASNMLSKVKGKEPGGDADWLAKTARKVQVLKAFAAALRAILLFDEIEDVTRAMRSAASDLAIWMEDDDVQIAAAAVLWHAALRGHESRLTPAMQVLPLATEELQRRNQPFAFFSRLLRCVVLADHARYAASLALLTKLEDRCEGWFTSDVDRADALRAISVVQIEVLSLWREHLSKPAQSRSRTWCDEKISELLTERFPQPSRTVLRLRPAIPLIASAEQLHRQPGDALKQPASEQRLPTN